MPPKKIIIIGGGAAGLMAAGQAATGGANVYLFEKKNDCGKKLRITGKGRCNLSNNCTVKEFITQFGKNGKFLYQSFAKFFNQDLIKFFNDLGVETAVERGGRIFPASEKAEDITEALIKWAKNKNVKFRNLTPVSKILIKNNSAIGVQVENKNYYADAVILCTGGLSYPATGSTGDGYEILESLGHTIKKTRPALVPLITEGNTAKNLQGLALKNVNLKLMIDGKTKKKIFGEMLFTHYGLSGPIVLTISKEAVDALDEKHEVKIIIDLKPALSNEQLENRLLRDFKEHSNQKFKSVLKNLLPAKLIPVCVYQTKIDPDKIINQIKSRERRALLFWLKNFQFEISGHRTFKEAIITAGGVNLKEINPKTMESKLIKNLFIAGELLDLDGNTGGYNLQAAFSTGWLAGKSSI